MYPHVISVYVLLTGAFVIGKTRSGLRHQNGRGHKENQRRMNRLALLLLPYLKIPEAYGSRKKIRKVHNKHQGLFGIEEESAESGFTFSSLRLRSRWI